MKCNCKHVFTLPCNLTDGVIVQWYQLRETGGLVWTSQQHVLKQVYSRILDVCNGNATRNVYILYTAN